MINLLNLVNDRSGTIALEISIDLLQVYTRERMLALHVCVIHVRTCMCTHASGRPYVTA